MTTVTTFGSDIRSLSSGTISKLLRDDYFENLSKYLRSRYSSSQNSLSIDPHKAANGWIIDRVQFAFARFADVCPDDSWESWQDAWEAYRKAFSKARFVCGYMGETDYEVDRVRYSCKHRVSEYEKSIYNGSGEEFERSVFPRVGTIYRHYGCTKGFPLESVCVLFPFSTPYRLVEEGDGYRCEYHPDYPLPRIGRSVCGDRCSFEYDASLEHTVEQYEEWRKLALAM